MPNLKNKRKKNINVPLTDDNEVNNNSMDNANNSPIIMKISKKNIDGNYTILNPNQKTVDTKTEQYKMNSTATKSRSKLDRIRSMPIYDSQ